MKWGVFDTVDSVWCGDDNGPRLFSVEEHGEMAELLAKCAAQMVDVRLDQDPGRTRARVFPEGQPLRVRDSKDYQIDGLTALKRMEEGI